MAEVLPLNFPIPTEAAIASYDFVDIQTGRGIVLYHLIAEKDTSGTTYKLTTETDTLTPRAIQVIQSSGDGSTTFTFYTGAFTSPRRIHGEAFFNFGFGGIGGASDQMKIEIKFYHYDGSTSTQMGSTWTSEWLAITTGAALSTRVNSSADLPLTQFNIGDKIKVEVNIVGDEDTGITDMEVGINPEDLNSGDTLTPESDVLDTSMFKIWIPFRIDI